VDSYESYGAEVSAIARRLGIKKVRIIDEPVSAALGYGLSVDNPKIVLVIDFGGSTLDLALVAINEKGVERGQCRVIAKTGLDLGGVVVDSWIVEKFCRSKAYDLGSFRTDRNASFWYSVMLDEAQRVKEGLYTREKETFYSAPPRELQDFYARIFAPDTALDAPLDLSREDLVDLLETNGLYAALSGSLDLLLGTASARSVPDEAIDEVLLVGGSCLLPGVYGAIERRFGRDRVRAWQPFNAVAYGNATFASGRFNKSDFVIHDYAIVTYDRGTGNPVHNVIVPRGTSFPTGRDFWKRQFTPLCAIGEPERIFKLLICEIGERHSVAQEFAWDTRGRLHTLDSENEKKLVVPLNDENPVLGYLHPPHRPDDKSARIEISFMVNENRWLLATVFDLKTRRNLLTDAPVVRLR
jgi:molecular chaperone DnaK (HSP70)